MNILQNDEPRLGGGKLISINNNKVETFSDRLKNLNAKSLFRNVWHYIRIIHAYRLGIFYSFIRFFQTEYNISVTILFPATEENHKAVEDLGYEITDNEPIELTVIAPKEFNEDIPSLEALILDYELWQHIVNNPDDYRNQKLGIVKIEFSKILCEFFLPIIDGR